MRHAIINSVIEVNQVMLIRNTPDLIWSIDELRFGRYRSDLRLTRPSCLDPVSPIFQTHRAATDFLPLCPEGLSSGLLWSNNLRRFLWQPEDIMKISPAFVGLQGALPKSVCTSAEGLSSVQPLPHRMRIPCSTPYGWRSIAFHTETKCLWCNEPHFLESSIWWVTVYI